MSTKQRPLRGRNDAGGGLDFSPQLARMMLMDDGIRPRRVVSITRPGAKVLRLEQTHSHDGSFATALRWVRSTCVVAKVEFSAPIYKPARGSQWMRVSVRTIGDVRDRFFDRLPTDERERLLAAVRRTSSALGMG